MDIFSKNKALLVVIVILIILKLATISSIWVFRAFSPSNISSTFSPLHPNAPSVNPIDALDFLAKQLKLDDNQVAKFQELRTSFFQNSRAAKDSIHENKKQLLNLVFEGNNDSAKANRYSDEIARLQKKIELMIYQHFAQFGLILTDKQKPEFKELLKDLVQENVKNSPAPPLQPPPPGMQPPPGDRPPPPDRRPPPPDGDGPPPPRR